MKEEFIPYTEALALKELGFDEPCLGFRNEYEIFGFFKTPEEGITNTVFGFYPTAPLYQQAFRWFRKKYKLFGEINLTSKQEDVEVFEFFILRVDECLFEDSKDYNIYEEAELECLKKLIEIVKEKK